ncbi:hypothetical protein ABID81_001001 [Frigoribacterium sp. PvP054]|uniref:hypothetical protein n=1 Tax=Frigoribacterium sp. PvP054 TaxID=3156438 RepID=UPI003390B6CF
MPALSQTVRSTIVYRALVKAPVSDDTLEMRHETAPVVFHLMAPSTTALLVAVGMTACASPPPVACASWPDYTTSAEMQEAATDVVVSSSVRSSGTEVMLGVDATVYDIRVAEVEKGSVAPGTTIRVISTPDSCGATFYPEGDQIDRQGPLRMYLIEDDDGTFQTLSPFDGVEPAP